MIEHLGEVPFAEVFPFLGGPPRSFAFGGHVYRVRLGSKRYQVFKESQACAACGRLGTVLMLDINPGDKSPHLNLYAVGDNCLVLMTRDHIVPRSLGGSEGLHNQRTMCSPCNHFRANDESLTLEEIRGRKRTRPIVKAVAMSAAGGEY